MDKFNTENYNIHFKKEKKKSRYYADLFTNTRQMYTYKLWSHLDIFMNEYDFCIIIHFILFFSTFNNKLTFPSQNKPLGHMAAENITYHMYLP